MFRSFFILITATATLTSFLNSASFAQEYFYYSRGQKIGIAASQEKISVKFKRGITEEQIERFMLNEAGLGNLKRLRPVSAQGFYTIQFKNHQNVNDLLERIRRKPEVDLIAPVFTIGGLEAIAFDHFIAQFKPEVTPAEIEALNHQHNVEIVSISTAAPNLYTLRITSASDLSVLEMSNLYYDALPCEWAVPDFIMPVALFSTPNDTYFSNQYYLHNTGQTGGVTDADIDAPEAWDISTGSSSIVVAVIDEGGAAHEDLPLSRIVAGYDYVYLDTDPSPGGNQAHGIAVVGVIAASQNNNLGITGVAPNCKVMNIRIFDEYGFPTSNGNIADAIDFAWENGAHVISNSWGYNSSNPNLVPGIVDAIITRRVKYFNFSSTKPEKIGHFLYTSIKLYHAPSSNRALTQGRNGKGCVVVFAAGNTANRGNNNFGYVAFPANVPGVLAVGATNKSNGIQFYSPRGSELAVVAPSGDLGYGQSSMICNGQTHSRVELRGDVWSLDIGSQAGVNPFFS